MNDSQEQRAVQIWQKYSVECEILLDASKEYTQAELDQQRRKVIPEVRTILEEYLSGKMLLDEFKTRNDSLNKRNRLWGFRGINGQMFFNMLTKTSRVGGKSEAFEKILRQSFPLPASPEQAAGILEEFAKFTKDLGKFVEDHRTAPKVGSIPFFLSYFWQIQSPETYPIYYTSMIEALQEYNIWSPSANVGQSYLSFFHLNHELQKIFAQEAHRPLTLWDVEHAFWFVNQPPSPVELNPRDSTPTPSTPEITPETKNITEIQLPDSYIPPIVGILPRLAVNDPGLAKLCIAIGSSIEVLFEKRIDILFKMLGYETEALGHGHGRVPDGVAICREFHYAIGYDAKVRQNSYSMGIDERAIREYIYGLSDRLRKQGIKQIYFMVISGSFVGDHDDVIRSIKMDTDVREILLVEAGALVALLEAKLRDPLLSLGPEGVQRLLAESGLLSEVDVKEFQGI